MFCPSHATNIIATELYFIFRLMFYSFSVFCADVHADLTVSKSNPPLSCKHPHRILKDYKIIFIVMERFTYTTRSESCWLLCLRPTQNLLNLFFSSWTLVWITRRSKWVSGAASSLRTFARHEISVAKYLYFSNFCPFLMLGWFF